MKGPSRVVFVNSSTEDMESWLQALNIRGVAALSVDMPRGQSRKLLEEEIKDILEPSQS